MQEKICFALPYNQRDSVLYAFEHAVLASKGSQALGLTVEQVERVYRDIVAKWQTATQLLQQALLVEETE
jgi:NAD+ synthase